MMATIPGLECIMLIDDDKAMNFIHKLAIDELKLDVETIVCMNGREALDYLGAATSDGSNANPRPGLILLDINMPLMDGWEFLEEFNRQLGPHQHRFILMMVSASTNPDDEDRALHQQNVSRFIHKPITAPVLREIIDTYFA